MAGQPPRDSITWNEPRRRYDWSTTLSDGRTKRGVASTPNEAEQIIRSWHVTTQPPRFREPRMPCGQIEPDR